MRTRSGTPPRARGRRLEVVWARPEGTPPRARGRRHRRRVRGADQRNTPACAGTIGRWSSPRAGSREHPRVRGDDLELRQRHPGETGTPPRARGRPRNETDRPRGGRNTPACAGTTRTRTRWTLDRPEHPRVWGRLRHYRSQHHRTGNTPACAGTTRSARTRSSPAAEHPRVRGDDRLWDTVAGWLMPTPPRARGRPTNAAGNVATGRNTTWSLRRHRLSMSEHPRVRGDDPDPAATRFLPFGTPPRARGRRARREPPRLLPGNTPACAGTTAGRPAPGTRGPEHPRVRGDDDQSPARHPRVTGTPPRARGRPLRGPAVPVPAGNTPACAGTTGPRSTRRAAGAEHPRVRGDDQSRTEFPAHIVGTPPRARGRLLIGRAPCPA